MASLRLLLRGYEDGQPMEKVLETPDRWTMHAADQLVVTIDDVEIVINQRVSAANTTPVQHCMDASVPPLPMRTHARPALSVFMCELLRVAR